MIEPEYGMMAQYSRAEPKPGKLPAELAEERERIEDRLAEFENIEGDALTDELMAEAAKLEERRTEIDEVEESLAVYNKKDRRRAGVTVTIGDDGGFCLHQGLIERGNADFDPEADTGDTVLADDDNDAFVPANGGDGDEEYQSSSPGAEQALRKEYGFSQSLIDDLKAHRQQITRAHLAGNFAVAFDLALYSLCTRLFRPFRMPLQPALDLRATEAHPRSSLNDLSGTAAERLTEAHRNALDLDWLELTPVQGFAALSGLPPAAKKRLFAWCIAAIIRPQLAIEDRADPVIEAAGRRLAIPLADCWRPTAANYWGRVKKAHGLAVGAEILGERWARDHADDKKPVLAAALETAFDPQKSSACVSLTQMARDNAAAWLPPGMGYGGDDRADDRQGAGDIDGAALESGDIDPAAADLPAFLTEDEPAALNGLSPAAG